MFYCRDEQGWLIWSIGYLECFRFCREAHQHAYRIGLWHRETVVGRET